LLIYCYNYLKIIKNITVVFAFTLQHSHFSDAVRMGWCKSCHTATRFSWPEWTLQQPSAWGWLPRSFTIFWYNI